MLKPVEKGADVITIKEFLELYNSGYITPYDGIGYLGYKNKCDCEHIVWDYIFNEKSFHKYTHVHWYNK